MTMPDETSVSPTTKIMSRAELNIGLALMDMSERSLARLTGYPYGRVRGWTSGRSPVPPALAAWIRQHVAFWQRHPPPRA